MGDDAVDRKRDLRIWSGKRGRVTFFVSRGGKPNLPYWYLEHDFCVDYLDPHFAKGYAYIEFLEAYDSVFKIVQMLNSQNFQAYDPIEL